MLHNKLECPMTYIVQTNNILAKHAEDVRDISDISHSHIYKK